MCPSAHVACVPDCMCVLACPNGRCVPACTCVCVCAIACMHEYVRVCMSVCGCCARWDCPSLYLHLGHCASLSLFFFFFFFFFFFVSLTPSTTCYAIPLHPFTCQHRLPLGHCTLFRAHFPGNWATAPYSLPILPAPAWAAA